jgi:hypothetical protein
MKLFKQVLDFYIRSSLHVALCFVALFHVTGFYAGFKLGFNVSILVFCAVVASYNLMKYGVLLLQKKQFRYRAAIMVVTGFCALLLLFLSLQETLHAQLVLVSSAVLCLLYILPLYRKHGLRFFPITKVVMVALCWVLLLVYYPAFSTYNSDITLENKLLNSRLFIVFAAQLFLFILALCIPFEIRDLKYDEVTLHTLPQLVGIKISKLFGIGLLALVPALEFVFKEVGLMRHAEVYAILLITALAIWFCDRFKSDYFVSLFVEAVPVLWLVLYHYLNFLKI